MKKLADSTQKYDNSSISSVIKASWNHVGPSWPLRNVIAVNPLQGLEELPIEQAMIEAEALFQQQSLPQSMDAVNRETIKWLQAFFDEGQATIPMPLRAEGLYHSFIQLACFDSRLHGGDVRKRKWLLELKKSPEDTVTECLLKLSIPKESEELFLTLMLTTLPGWAAYAKYRLDWSQEKSTHSYPLTGTEYLAVRLIITCLLWEQASQLIVWHKNAKNEIMKKSVRLNNIILDENHYRLALLKKLSTPLLRDPSIPDAQLVFCIDVRSEPLRRAIEAQGNYETFGFAGFFGIPIHIKSNVTQESYSSCPVLLKPKHTIEESSCSSPEVTTKNHKGQFIINSFKYFYQSLKYNFITPFILVEALGLISGLWMAIRTLAPLFASKLQDYMMSFIRPSVFVTPSLTNISISEQCVYAENFLKMIGLTENFSPLVILCGHGSSTQNNAYATALDCGACGGRHGGSNARVLASILNSEEVRKYLCVKKIFIPENTWFLAGEHNTTTDDIELYLANIPNASTIQKIEQLKHDLTVACRANSDWRANKLGFRGNANESKLYTKLCSISWSQTRPEWGLAQNASFIIGPRKILKGVDLEGRAFLHSYDYRQDPDGASLTTILTAPMVVAQWINSQYMFSTLDNVAYGSGSKVTQNITGKIGVMQGNASDLMHGLPLQSVYMNDKQAYHKAQRLLTVVYAPCDFIDKIISKNEVLQKLFGNGWVMLLSINQSDTQKCYMLQRNLTWEPA